MAAMELMDTHCHLDVSDFDPDRTAVLQRARAAGVRHLLIPAVTAAGWEALWAFCAADANLYPALGLHPVYIDDHRREDLDRLREWLGRRRPVAIGEIGLDFYVRDLDRAEQMAVFEAQLALAREFELPVVLHVRKAHDAVLQALKQAPPPGGFVHAFNGSLQQARQYQALGFRFGFGGMLTFERSTKLRRLAAELPLDALVLETDAPDMTVAAHRGERNSPEYLPDCLAALAQVRGEPPERVAEQTTCNALETLGLG
jgi:TatD DNase family protein